MDVVCILEQATYKPGDLPPTGYLEWHEWAEVQRKAGIKQRQCGKCGKWKTPQEMSSRQQLIEMRVISLPVCAQCDDSGKIPANQAQD